jgi:hypothetical protein
VQLAENSDGYMQSDNDYTSNAWSWLKKNELPSSNAARDSWYINIWHFYT